jgi:signal transduction histidine kinase
MPSSSSTETRTREIETGSVALSRAERLAVAAHDLRSPLNAILGWARILSIKHGSDPDIAAIAQRIERSGRSQLKVIEELSELARDERDAEDAG